MRVRIDAAGHDVAAARVEHLAALQVLPDRGDLLALDQHIGAQVKVGGDDGAVLDDFGHGLKLPH